LAGRAGATLGLQVCLSFFHALIGMEVGS